MPGGCARIAACVGPPPRPGGAAAAVEDRQLDPALARQRRERLLRAVDLPLRRQVAAVLARVGVADHDLEPVAAARHERAEARRRRAARRRSRGAARRSSIVSNSGTSDEVARRASSASVERARARRRRRLGAGDDERVERVACRSARARCAASSSVARGALVGLRAPARVHAHVELGDVEAEELDAAAQRRQPAVGDALAARGAQAAVEQARSASQLGGVGVARLVAAARASLLEPRARSAVSLRAVRLVGVRSPISSREARQRRLVAAIERQQRPRRRRRAGRARRARARARAPRRGSGAAPASRARASASPMRSGAAVGLPSWSPPIQLPKRSGEPAVGQRAAAMRPSSVARRRRTARRSKNHSPWRISSTTRGRLRAHLVGLPEARDLLGQRPLDAARSRRRARARRAASSSPAQAQLALQHRAARGLGRVRRQHELERRSALAPAARLATPPRSWRERGVERLAGAARHRPRRARGGARGGAARRGCELEVERRTRAAPSAWRSIGQRRR